MGFEERLNASVCTDNLKSDDLKLMPVDFVASLSGASSLGSDIMRSSDYDQSALRRALRLLTKDAINALHIGRGVASRLSVVAINEVLHWQCRRCNGAGEVIAGKVRIECPDCNGYGTHRWSDGERARLARLPPDIWRKWEKKYALVLEIARVESSFVVELSKRKMG